MNELTGLPNIGGVRWHSIPGADRAELKSRFDALLRRSGR